ncbi:MAG: 2'-deoxycytidine 5'-triphosphate deaminase [Alphaproteobacteria bacterium]|nr:2'-deoxycytidine 5'-triphosphate deaminase [Alphaproteobacteria bacterium]
MTRAAARADGRAGILPYQELASAIARGAVTAREPIAETQIQPASLDLRLGPVAHRLRASFLPGRGASVADRLEDFVMHTISLETGAVLETGCVYLVPLTEQLALPPDISGTANPKSSTGRLDVFTRLIADHSTGFDRVQPGYSGPLYAEICPQTFSILVRTGSSLSQLRLRRGEARIDDDALARLHAEEHIVDRDGDIENGLALTLDLQGMAGEGARRIGYRAKRHSGVVDVDRIGAYDPLDFWEPLQGQGDRPLILDPNEFYILASKEAVRIPASHAAEMVPFDPLVGEFRVHYAGFLDPGFGYGPHGASRIVLEVRSHEVPFALEDGQVVGRLHFERMAAVPDRLYGVHIRSHYQGQALKLSKHFR